MQLIVPFSLWESLLDDLHSGAISAHMVKFTLRNPSTGPGECRRSQRVVQNMCKLYNQDDDCIKNKGISSNCLFLEIVAINGNRYVLVTNDYST